MNEDDPNTPSPQPVQTGGEQPTATPPQGGDGASDDSVMLKRDDYNNLIAQRDRSNNALGELDESVAGLLKGQAINEFLESNGTKFPDVTRDDLMRANSPEELEEIAKSTQKRIEDAVQKKLMDVQKTTAPALTPEQRATELKKLKDSPTQGGFQRMLELRSEQ